VTDRASPAANDHGEAASRGAGHGLRLSDPAGRWLLAAAAAGSGLVLLEATVVNVALPAVETDLDASLMDLQWAVNAFALTLSALILTGGGLGDRFGRRRVYVVGVALFGVASLLCGAAPTMTWLIAGRALQGIGGALIVPGSLALIQSAFHPDDRNRAVGWWAGMSGVAGAAGPFVGGGLIDIAGWRWVFFINVPLAVIIAALLIIHVPESHAGQPRRFDLWGAAWAAAALATLTYALTETSNRSSAVTVGSAGVAAFVVFLLVEQRTRTPMLPLRLFRSRQFSTANVASFLAYGGLAGLFFLLPIQLQVAGGYSASAAGLAILPLTILTLAVAPSGGELASRLGPRAPLLAGSLTCTVALLLAARIGVGSSYLVDVLPVVVLIGIGLPLITPPITSAVLSAVPEDRVGIASAVNNGVARAAGLVAVAALPLLAGLPQDIGRDVGTLDHGFEVGMLICAGLFLACGITTWFGLPRVARIPS
jgi:EmrB/QacA subfamily drug resistance transporter